MNMLDAAPPKIEDAPSPACVSGLPCAAALNASCVLPVAGALREKTIPWLQWLPVAQ